MTSPTPVCLFAKPPIPGKAKTRLHAALGPEGAAALAHALALDTWEGLQALGWARPRLCSPEPWPLALLPEGVAPDDVWPQGEGDLGAKLTRIAERALETSDRVLFVGADAPGLPAHLLEQARDTFADAVFGPADDGGFYLLGLRTVRPGMLANLPWSAPTTLARTRAQLEAFGLTTAALPPWFDVDTPEDLARLKAALASGAVRAPRTAQALGVAPGEAENTAPAAPSHPKPKA